MSNSGTQILALTPTASGGYIDCSLRVMDHGGNISNEIILPSFVYDVGNDTVCWRDGLTVSFTACTALVDIYEALEGDSWFVRTNRLTSPDVDTWFGITVTEGEVTEFSM